MPAPMRPIANGSPVQAASAAARPPAASGGVVRTDSSNTDMPTTIGTGPAGVRMPSPRSRSRVITPSAADSPNADPPESTTASTRSTRRVGSSSSNSRVAGAPPRTSPEAIVPGGGRITVTPVPAVVQCPAQADSSCGSGISVSCTRGATGGPGPVLPPPVSSDSDGRPEAAELRDIQESADRRYRFALTRLTGGQSYRPVDEPVTHLKP